MIEQLASLLLPIEALLNHEDFDPRSNASSELVGLFRSMWFLCSLFHFAMFEEKDQIAMNWVRQVLGKIASKTPTIVVEEAMDLVGELEYNTVIRREYAHTVGPSGCESLCGLKLMVVTDNFETPRHTSEAYTT
jgi:phosphatidylinositol 4-kinase